MTHCEGCALFVRRSENLLFISAIPGIGKYNSYSRRQTLNPILAQRWHAATSSDEGASANLALSAKPGSSIRFTARSVSKLRMAVLRKVDSQGKDSLCRIVAQVKLRVSDTEHVRNAPSTAAIRSRFECQDFKFSRRLRGHQRPPSVAGLLPQRIQISFWEARLWNAAPLYSMGCKKSRGEPVAE